MPAAVAPVAVPAPREVARVDCRAYAFEKEDLRITYEADLANINISWNIALNTGALDEAARLQGEADATQQQRSLDEARLQAQYPGC